MNPKSQSEIARELKAGRLPEAPLWLLAEAAQLIADELISPANSAVGSEIRNAVDALNGGRLFELTRKIAEAWLATRGFDPGIQKRLVQSMINTALLDRAEALARNGIAKCEAMPGDAQARIELPEYQGLIGRIYKQRFVTGGDRNDLVRAADQYYREYDKDKLNNYWHGINALALLTLEVADAPARVGTPALDEMAEQIRATVTKAYSKKRKSWLASTASEACLALGNCDEAELWLYRFLHLKDTRPFDIDSYSRQIREIWGGEQTADNTCPDRLAGIIARFLSSEQRRVVIDPANAAELKAAIKNNPVGLEKNFLGESSFSVDDIDKLLKRCRSIGCVMNDIGERLGTGFLVRGSWLKPSFGDAPVFVTNAHVIGETVPRAIPRDKARVTFELEVPVNGRRPEYRVANVLFTSVPGKIGITNTTGEELDCTIVTLDGLPLDAPVLAGTFDLPEIRPKSKAYVVGHPRGAGLQISLHDSKLLDIDDQWRLVHYRTPTDPGSSGSPVFNQAWDVMALHHAGTSETPRLHGNESSALGMGTYEANEGIALGAIQRKLNR